MNLEIDGKIAASVALLYQFWHECFVKSMEELWSRRRESFALPHRGTTMLQACAPRCLRNAMCLTVGPDLNLASRTEATWSARKVTNTPRGRVTKRMKAYFNFAQYSSILLSAPTVDVSKIKNARIRGTLWNILMLSNWFICVSLCFSDLIAGSFQT